MPKPLKSLFLITALLGTLLAALYQPLPLAAQSTNTYFITNVDSSHFPDITFSLRAVDINNKTLTNLNNTSFTVYENGQAVTGPTVTPHNDAPLYIIYVIDLGFYSNYVFLPLDNLRQAISTLVSGGYFVDGRDTVQVLARQNLNGDQTVELRHSTTKSTDLTDWVGTYDFPRSGSLTKGLLGVSDALKAMATLVPSPGTAATAIVFISRFIEDPANSTAQSAAQAVAQAARSQYVSIYVMQTDSSQFNSQPLQTLATGSNGIYVALQRNNIASAAASIYQTIAGQRAYYTVTYRSQLQTSGTRQITIDTAGAPSSGLAGSYQISVAPPTIDVIQPVAGSTIRREAKLAPGSTVYVYDVNTTKVTASISWPAGVPGRSLKLAELLVNGNVEDKKQPQVGATTVDFTWDISGIAKPGSNLNNLVVRVTDELGVQASSAASTINVEVVPPPAPTLVPTATAVPTPAPAGVGQFLPYAVVVVICLGLLLVLGLALLALSRSRRRQGLGGVPAGSYEAPNTMIVGAPGSGQGLASVTVLEGPSGMVGEVYSLVKPVTVIGRNPGRCDIVFYPNQESSMSRVHCTIQQDGMYFQITDNRSSNGTQVNGTKIKGNEPVQLRDGDEIILGQLAKLGVKLRFSQRADKAMGDIADRTFIVDDWDKQGFDKFKDGQ